MKRICLVGDVMLGRSFDAIYDANPQYRWLDTELQQWIEDSDYIIGNLETSITTSTKKWPNKVFNFKIRPDNFARAATNLRFDYLSLANNHSLDYGLDGLLETINTLDNLNIKHAGAARSKSKAHQPEDLEKMKIFSAADHPKDFQNNVWISEDMDDVIEAVRKEREKGYKGLIICSLHWGSNYMSEPTDKMQRIGLELLEVGTNIVNGHSAHHLLPMERIGNSVIFYSMGDFIDDYVVDKEYRNDLSAVVKIKVKGALVMGIEIMPTKIKRLKTVPSTGKEAEHSIDILLGNKKSDDPL